MGCFSTIEIDGWEYEKREKYYLYSKEGPLNTMKISYRVQSGYLWCKCGIQVGYIDGTTKDRYICEYNSDDDIWEAKTEIQMSDVLIVLVAIQKNMTISIIGCFMKSLPNVSRKNFLSTNVL